MFLALIASMLKIALAAQVPHADDPARVLLGLNQALCGKFQHHFVTAAYVFLDLEKQSLTYAGAGHPPLLLWSRTEDGTANEVRQIEENGLFLGKFSFATYTSVELPLTPNGWILLYSDGIPETDTKSPLVQMTAEERLVADFHGTGLTVGPHPLAYRRQDLRRAS